MNRIIYDESLNLLKSPFYSLTMPLVYSVLTGLSLLFLTASFLVVFEVTAAWKIGLIAFCLAQSVIWILAVSRWMTAFHRITSSVAPYRDTKEVPNVTVWLPLRDGETGSHRYDLPATDNQLYQLASGVLEGKSFTEAQWIGRGKPFNNRREWVDLRDEMITQNLVDWKNQKDHTAGIRVTNLGLDMFRRLIDTPLPSEVQTIDSRIT